MLLTLSNCSYKNEVQFKANPNILHSLINIIISTCSFEFYLFQKNQNATVRFSEIAITQKNFTSE